MNMTSKYHSWPQDSRNTVHSLVIPICDLLAGILACKHLSLSRICYPSAGYAQIGMTFSVLQYQCVGTFKNPHTKSSSSHRNEEVASPMYKYLHLHTSFIEWQDRCFYNGYLDSLLNPLRTQTSRYSHCAHCWFSMPVRITGLTSRHTCVGFFSL